MVHHGGIGTCAQALRAGIPQLVLPWGVDQFDNALRLKKLGVARVGNYLTARAGSLRRGLTWLLETEEVVAACRHHAARLAEDDPLAATVDAIEAHIP